MKRNFLFFYMKGHTGNEKDCRLPILDILSSSRVKKALKILKLRQKVRTRNKEIN